MANIELLLPKGIIDERTTMRTKLDPRYDQPAETKCYSMEHVGKVIRSRRKELGYTQTQIAQFSGCSQRLISEIERGKPTVAFETVLRIANGLGIDLVLAIRGKK